MWFGKKNSLALMDSWNRDFNNCGVCLPFTASPLSLSFPPVSYCLIVRDGFSLSAPSIPPVLPPSPSTGVQPQAQPSVYCLYLLPTPPLSLWAVFVPVAHHCTHAISLEHPPTHPFLRQRSCLTFGKRGLLEVIDLIVFIHSLRSCRS